MITLLAFLEGGVIFASLTVALSAWHRAFLGGDVGIVFVLTQAGALSSCVLLALLFADSYSPRAVRSVQSLLASLPRAFAASAFLISGWAAVMPVMREARHPFESGLLLTIGVLFGPLLPVRVLTAYFARSYAHVTQVLIVGSNQLARRLIGEIKWRPESGYVVTGVVEEAAGGNACPLHGTSLDSFHDLDWIIEQTKPDRIVVAFTDRRGRLPIQQLLRARMYRGIPIDDAAAFYEQLTGKLALEAFPPSQIVFSRDFRPSRLSLAVRRACGVLLATLGLVLTAPLFGVIALAVKLDSQGPIFFAQRRVGLHGKPFTLLKFRTMDAVENPPSEWVRDNAHRITRVGRWLRLLWLDELPQLVNILRGDMDLVGPRAHPVSNFELMVLVSRNVPEFSEPIPYYALRCMVRPGLTGWAQVRYQYANDLDEEIEKLRYDLYYIKHASIWLDLRILFETLKVILCGHSRDTGDPVLVFAETDRRRTFAVPEKVRRPAEFMPQADNAAIVKRSFQ